MRTVTVVGVIALAACVSAPSSVGSEQDDTRIRQVVAQEEAAWNRGDAKLYAAHFQPDGGFTNVLGNVYCGHQAFEDRHAQLLATVFAGSNLKMDVRKVHYLRPDVAVVDIDTALTGYKALPPGLHAGADGAVRTRLQQVMVKRQSDWWIAAYHNIDIKP